MAVFLFANNAHTTLAGPIATGATSLTLAAGTGTLFPSLTTGQQFAMTLTSQASSTQREIVYCTARSGDVCTIVRGQEGTTPLSFVAGDFADNYLTAGTTAAFIQAPQLQQQAGNYAVDTGTVNALVATFYPAPASLALLTGVPLRIKIANTNTGATTLSVNGLATTTVTDLDGSALNSGELLSGAVALIIYNGTSFQLLTPNLLTANNVWSGLNTFSNVVSTTGTIGALTFAGSGHIRGSAGGLSLDNNAGSASNLFLADNGTATFRSTATSATRFRNTLGALGSGDLNATTILNDFNSSVGGSPGGSYVYQELPSGIIIQAYTGQSPTGSDFITFPNPFPNGCIEVIACEGNPIGWNNGANPSIFGCQQLSRTSFALYVVIWNGSSWNLHAGVTYRYIAIGY